MMYTMESVEVVFYKISIEYLFWNMLQNSQENNRGKVIS